MRMSRAPSRFAASSLHAALLATVVALTALSPAAGSASDQHHTAVPADELVWNPGPTLPPGAQLAVLQGSPAKEGPFDDDPRTHKAARQ